MIAEWNGLFLGKVISLKLMWQSTSTDLKTQKSTKTSPSESLAQMVMSSSHVSSLRAIPKQLTICMRSGGISLTKTSSYFGRVTSFPLANSLHDDASGSQWSVKATIFHSAVSTNVFLFGRRMTLCTKVSLLNKNFLKVGKACEQQWNGKEWKCTNIQLLASTFVCTKNGEKAMTLSFFFICPGTLHSGLKLYEGDPFISYKKPLSLKRGSERSERASEWVSTAEGASEASSPEQANEWAVRANERTDERVAQYLRIDSCLFQTIVHRNCHVQRDFHQSIQMNTTISLKPKLKTVPSKTWLHVYMIDCLGPYDWLLGWWVVW